MARRTGRGAPPRPVRRETYRVPVGARSGGRKGKGERFGLVDRALVALGVGGRTREVVVKRDCSTGQFVARDARANRCGAKRAVPVKWVQATAPDSGEGLCYPTRSAMLAVFRDWNARQIDAAGGLGPGARTSSGGEWDPVNERFGRKGKGKVRTLEAAVEACAPRGQPFCLDAIDLDTLNECGPVAAAGGFTLPDATEEARLSKKAEKAWREMEREGEQPAAVEWTATDWELD